MGSPLYNPDGPTPAQQGLELGERLADAAERIAEQVAQLNDADRADAVGAFASTVGLLLCQADLSPTEKVREVAKLVLDACVNEDSCTGYLNDDGQLQHDGDTCPVHEGGRELPEGQTDLTPLVRFIADHGWIPTAAAPAHDDLRRAGLVRRDR